MRKYSILELGSVSVRFIALIILLLSEPTIENFLIAQSIYGVFYGFFGIYLCVKDLKITKLKKRDFLKYSFNLSSGPALSLRINKKGPNLRDQKISRKNINIWFASKSGIKIIEVTPTLMKEKLPIKSKKISLAK